MFPNKPKPIDKFFLCQLGLAILFTAFAERVCAQEKDPRTREREEKELLENAGHDWHPETLHVPGFRTVTMRVDHDSFSRLALSGKGYLAYVPLSFFLTQAERMLLTQLASTHILDEMSQAFLLRGLYHGFEKKDLHGSVEITPLSGIRDPQRPYFYAEDFTSVKLPANLSSAQEKLFWSAVWKKCHEFAVQKEYYLSCFENEADCDDSYVSPAVANHWKSKETYVWRREREELLGKFIKWYTKNSAAKSVVSALDR